MTELNMVDVGRSFIYVEAKNEDWTAIKLSEITGKYSKTIYKYGKVSIDEKNVDEDGSLPLTFEYDVLSSDIPESELNEDSEFKNLIGNILMYILEEQLKKDSMQYVNTDD